MDDTNPINAMPEGRCSVEGCDHYLFHGDTCACHLDVNEFYKMSHERQVEAVSIAALENDNFEVNIEGDVRLKGEKDG